MKKLILTLLLIPYLLLSQVASNFSITDTNGNTWELYSLLDEGTTVVIQFFSPSMTCWPSSNSIENLTNAHYEYSCNNIVFLQVAQWGWESEVVDFINEFGTTNIPTIPGYYDGSELTMNYITCPCGWNIIIMNFIHQYLKNIVNVSLVENLKQKLNIKQLKLNV